MSDLALLDTNVLVYSVFADSVHHAASRALLDQAADPDARFCLLPQNIVEFYAAVTSPRRVSEPKSSTEALHALADILALTVLTPSDV
jgi:predicted nucleic acid-binding protein